MFSPFNLRNNKSKEAPVGDERELAKMLFNLHLEPILTRNDSLL
jgi:hypothetical protein